MERSSGPRPTRFYTRDGNPTVARAAQVVAALEGSEAALLFSSGVAATTTALLTLLKAGDHVICQDQVYAGTQAFLNTVMRDFGVDATFVDQRYPEAFEQAMTPRTRLFLLETPCHPLMRVTDLRAVSEIAHERGALTMVDNTTASPVNQRPLEFGVDLVMHSATKFLGGHSDLLAGALAGDTHLIDRIWKRSKMIGAVMSPHDAWLLLRGMRTVALRVQRHNENGLRVAQALETHRAVEHVYYPGLQSHPQHALAARQMGLRRFRRAPSIGAVESLAIHPFAMWRNTLSADELQRRGVSPGLVRLSLGIDAGEDIVADVTGSLDAL
ncbi:MAG TPA: aminotransferase class I/II-fold pyridoxal phosphate-dependent enzyme [Candidatus Baltobacteraceae bacterium]|nr:aminotransferase class I/II-fold pyridoxal phosphate-dependent enzyme [Candidatus Baltobacteraceae bacterium]